MGVAGVAWATFLCQGVSCLLAVVFVIRRLSAVRTEKPAAVFSWTMLGRIGVIAVPSILQQSFISVGNFFVNRCINGLDDTGDAITGFTTAFKIIIMCTMSTVAMTNGFSNFASQNKAAGEYGRIRKGFWIMALYMLVVCVVFMTSIADACPVRE